MKKYLFLSLILISNIFVQAQRNDGDFHHEKRIDVAAILAPKPSSMLGFSSVSEARSIINNIMSHVSIQQNFTVVSTTTIDNAAAVVFQGKRYILYNPSFINILDRVAKDKWASVSVVAHEIGHHLLGHTLDGRGSQHVKELEADAFSGLVLRRMGASLQQSQLAMQLISTPNATTTHPGLQDRLAAISKGWNTTTTQSNTNDDVAIEYPKSEQQKTNPSQRNEYPQRTRENTTQTSGNTGSQALSYEVKFKNANGNRYFITSKNNVVKYNGNKLHIVAKIAPSRSANYPYVIYDDEVQLYVDKRGNIVSSKGRSVGYIARA